MGEGKRTTDCWTADRTADRGCSSCQGGCCGRGSGRTSRAPTTGVGEAENWRTGTGGINPWSGRWGGPDRVNHKMSWWAGGSPQDGVQLQPGNYGTVKHAGTVTPAEPTRRRRDPPRPAATRRGHLEHRFEMVRRGTGVRDWCGTGCGTGAGLGCRAEAADRGRGGSVSGGSGTAGGSGGWPPSRERTARAAHVDGTGTDLGTTTGANRWTTPGMRPVEHRNRCQPARAVSHPWVNPPGRTSPAERTGGSS